MSIDLETLDGRREAFDAWSAKRKRELGPLAGLSFSKTNTGGWCFSRHWPHLLCWSWAVWITPYRGPQYEGPRSFRAYRLGHNAGGQAGLTLWFFTLTAHWQSYEHIAALGPAGRDAPRIHPRTREAA
jgi:hypothetical protein